MAATVGLIAALGVALIYASCWPADLPDPARTPWRGRTARDLRALGSASAGAVLACGVGYVVTVALTDVPALGFLVGAVLAGMPRAFARWRADQGRAERVAAWPDIVDNLASAIRAGMSLPEALAGQATSGPPALRSAFGEFDRMYRATGRMTDALDHLQGILADPIADRLCALLRMAREVGGSDVGRLLRTQSEFLRADASTRADVAAAQSWSVYAARMAVSAPWIVLAMMASRPQALTAFRTPTGAAIIIGAAALCVAAYRLMMWIARLPEPVRILV